MAGTESQRIIDLVHELAGPAMTVKQCLPPKLQAQGIAEKPLKNKGVSRKDVVDKTANRQPLTEVSSFTRCERSVHCGCLSSRAM